MLASRAQMDGTPKNRCISSNPCYGKIIPQHILRHCSGVRGGAPWCSMVQKHVLLAGWVLLRPVPLISRIYTMKPYLRSMALCRQCTWRQCAQCMAAGGIVVAAGRSDIYSVPKLTHNNSPSTRPHQPAHTSIYTTYYTTQRCSKTKETPGPGTHQQQHRHGTGIDWSAIGLENYPT